MNKIGLAGNGRRVARRTSEKQGRNQEEEDVEKEDMSIQMVKGSGCEARRIKESWMGRGWSRWGDEEM